MTEIQMPFIPNHLVSIDGTDCNVCKKYKTCLNYPMTTPPLKYLNRNGICKKFRGYSAKEETC